MEKDRVCRKCSLSINAHVDLFTVCEGDCAGCFHAACVGLSEGDLGVLSMSSMNIIWMCDACSDKFRKKRDGIWHEPTEDVMNVKSVEEEVNLLKTTVAGIMDTLSKIVPTAASLSDKPLLHSTPIPSSSCKLFNGTNATGSDMNSDVRQCTTDGNEFSLFLTNIDESVTERDIRLMVSCALGTPESECIDVVKLASKWHHRRPLDYISFKVILDKQWKARAMDPSIWPKTIKFREFINLHNNTWKPELY